jgi:branched-chain amino acid transport system permease protein
VSTQLKGVLWALLVIVAALAPFGVDPVSLGRLQQVAYFAVAVMSMNLLTGMTGQISLGHGAFMGLGAYATALGVQNYGLSYWTMLPVAILIGGFVGAVCGLPALRIRGMYLAMATLAVGLVFPQIPVRFTTWTGGSQGLTINSAVPSPSPALANAWPYWVILVVTVIVFGVSRNLIQSRVGRSLQAVRDQEIAARTLGVSVNATKIGMYSLSAAIAAVAGWMFAITNQFVSPADFTVFISINLLLGMTIGGAGSLIGPVIGGAFLVYSTNVIPTLGLNPLLTPVVYGVVLILVLYFLPQGAGGLLRSIDDGLRKRRPEAVPTAMVGRDDPAKVPDEHAGSLPLAVPVETDRP